jgi:hypothetical protein
MAAEKNPKKPQESRSEDEPRSYVPEGKGTIKVRVFASERKDRHDVVRRVKVTLTGPREASERLPISGETDDFGEVTFEVPAGNWQAEATAFGETDTSDWEEVKPRCETCIDLVLDIDLHVRTSVVTDSALASGEPKFYRAGTIILASAECTANESALSAVVFEWSVSGGSILEEGRKVTGREIHVDTSGARGQLDIGVTMIGDGRVARSAALTIAPAPTVPVAGAVNVGLRRSATTITPDLPLWVVIRNSTDGLAFKNYQRYIDIVLCDAPTDGLSDGFVFRNSFSSRRNEFDRLKKRRFLPFSDSDAYRLLKVATEAFVMVNTGVALTSYPPFEREDLELLISRTGVDGLGMDRFERLWNGYLERVNGTRLLTLPYLALIANKFPDARVKSRIFSALQDVELAEPCNGLLAQKLSEPCLVELIWSYWHEEAMLVQSINAVSLRFQNRRARHGDPLANMEISPLRPLNNLLWGYIQDEQHRLTVMRRADEYDHEYGLRLEGRATPHYRTADSRVQFLRAFHNLLHLASVFFQKDDDTTVLADAFPVLNALKEVHLILSQGAHNQFGDLPVTARVEMLMQQWIMARPEFAEFLPTRAMVAYPEPWMDRVDAMKRLQGWSDVNVLHFRDLGVFGEKLLLTIRYGSWVDVNDPDQAKNWLRAWRPEIQGYIHAYRAVTGADVTTEPVNAALPSALLQQRFAQQPRPRAYLGNPGF